MTLTENLGRSELMKNRKSPNVVQFLFGGLARVMTASFLMQPLQVMRSTMRAIQGAAQTQEYQPTSQTVLSILSTEVVLRGGYKKMPTKLREPGTPERPYLGIYNVFFENMTFPTAFLKTFLGIKSRDIGAFIVTPAAAALSGRKKSEENPKPEENPKTDDDDGRRGCKGCEAVFDEFLKSPGKYETFWHRPYSNYYNRYYSQW